MILLGKTAKRIASAVRFLIYRKLFLPAADTAFLTEKLSKGGIECSATQRFLLYFGA